MLPVTGYQIVYFEMRGLISILYLYFSIHCDEQPRNHCAVHAQQHILVMLCLLYFCKQLPNIWHHCLQRLHTVLVWWGISLRAHASQFVQGCFLFLFCFCFCFFIVVFEGGGGRYILQLLCNVCTVMYAEWLTCFWTHLVTPYVNWNSHCNLLCRPTQIIMIRRSLSFSLSLSLSHTNTHTHTHTHTHARTHTRTHTHAHAHAQTQTHTHTRTRAHTHAHAPSDLQYLWK